MIFNTCPECGANLDPGEVCDCKKEKGLPNANQYSPKKGEPSNAIVTHKKAHVKDNPLKILRITHNIPIKEIIERVQQLYPKYDKYLQSKVEHGEEYGIDLRADAFDDLLATYDPDALVREKYRRGGCHKLTCRVSCRLEDREYEEFKDAIYADGFDTVQDGLTYIVRNYMKNRKEQINGNL